MGVKQIHNEGRISDSIGYLAEAIDDGADRVLICVIKGCGAVEAHGFGELTVAELTMIGCWVQHRAVEMVVPDDGGE